MVSNYVVASDNGKSGFMVFLDIKTARIAHIEQCPPAKRMYELLKEYNPLYAVTEQVFMSSGFKSVASVGFIVLGRYIQCFEMLDIPYEAIRAVEWRKVLGLKAKGREQQKLAAIEMCKQAFHTDDQDLLKTEFSHIVDHHRVQTVEYDNNKCESALIALYALKQFNSKFSI